MVPRYYCESCHTYTSAPESETTVEPCPWRAIVNQRYQWTFTIECKSILDDYRNGLNKDMTFHEYMSIVAKELGVDV